MTTGPEHAAGWTPDRVNRLVSLWNKGPSAGTIARILGGGVSRNGVIGKAHRLGLPGRPTPLRVQKSVEEKHRHAMRRRANGKAKAKPRHVLNPMLPPPMPIPAWDALPGSSPIGIMDLSNDTCRWPLGERPYRYCGCAPEADSVYCAQHKAIAHRPPVFPVNNSEAILASDTSQKPLSAHGEYAPTGRADLHRVLHSLRP